MNRYPAATVACFDPTQGALPRRQLDPDRFAEFLQRLARAGAPAVLIAASTGHGHLRTREELEHFFEAANDVDLGQTRKLALLRPEDGVEFNRRLLARLQAGYDVVFFRPGNDLGPNASDEQVVEQLRPLVLASAEHEFPVGLYSISDVSGVPLSADAVAQLVASPGGEQIVAVKVTEADYESSTLTFLTHPDLAALTIVQGWDPHLTRALRDGCDERYSPRGVQRCGITSGPMSFAVYQYLHMLAAAERHEWEEVSTAQQAITALFASMQDHPTKFADLQRAKFIMGLGHPLCGETTDPQVARVLATLKALPRQEDRHRLANSLNLMEDGPYRETLQEIATG